MPLLPKRAVCYIMLYNTISTMETGLSWIFWFWLWKHNWNSVQLFSYFISKKKKTMSSTEGTCVLSPNTLFIMFLYCILYLYSIKNGTDWKKIRSWEQWALGCAIILNKKTNSSSETSLKTTTPITNFLWSQPLNGLNYIWSRSGLGLGLAGVDYNTKFVKCVALV